MVGRPTWTTFRWVGRVCFPTVPVEWKRLFQTSVLCRLSADWFWKQDNQATGRGNKERGTAHIYVLTNQYGPLRPSEALTSSRYQEHMVLYLFVDKIWSHGCFVNCLGSRLLSHSTWPASWGPAGRVMISSCIGWMTPIKSWGGGVWEFKSIRLYIFKEHKWTLYYLTFTTNSLNQ